MNCTCVLQSTTSCGLIWRFILMNPSAKKTDVRDVTLSVPVKCV